MSRIPLGPATLVTVLALLTVGLSVPAAADVACTGSIGAQTIDDNLAVPDGSVCTLVGTTVDGNILVGRGARLSASDITVGGNIQDLDNGAGAVDVAGSRVGGNVQLEQGTSATVADTSVDGDVQLESNSGALRAEDNDIGGNLQANGNTGGVAITGNTIGGNLQCQSNTPPPTGSGNVVQGDAEGQCADLSGDPSPMPPPGSAARSTGRLSGPDRYGTAAQIARAAFPGGAPVVYLARSDDFADALAASSLSDGPILLVRRCGTVPAATLEAIRHLDPQRVVALGGQAAVCDAVLQAAASA